MGFINYIYFKKIVGYATDDPKIIIGDRSNLQFTQVYNFHIIKSATKLKTFLIEEIRSKF